MTKIIAIDHGNSHIKTPNFSFPSGLTQGNGLPGESITYLGEEFSLSNKRLPYRMDKTQDQKTFLLTLFAIGKELERELEHQYCEYPDEIILAVGLPPAFYKTGKDQFVSYLQKEDPVQFSYKDTEFEITIKDVLVFPQTYAAAAYLGSAMEEERAYVVDIGGWTVDTLCLRNGTPDMDYTFSLEYGVNKLLNKLSSELPWKFSIREEELQIINFSSRKSKLPEEAKAYIRDEMKKFANELVEKLEERGFDFRFNSVFFIGGGSELLREFLEETGKIKSAHFESSVNMNALGYRFLAEEVLHGAV